MARRTEFVGLNRPTPAQINRATDKYLMAQAELISLLRNSVYQAEVTIFPPNDIASVHYISDEHLFSPHRDKPTFGDTLAQLSAPGHYCILGGDIIDAYTLAHPDTIVGSGGLTFGAQIESVACKLAKLAQRGKILATITESQHHEGWLYSYGISGADLALNQTPYSRQIPRLMSGGVLYIRVSSTDNPAIPVRCFHQLAGSRVTSPTAPVEMAGLELHIQLIQRQHMDPPDEELPPNIDTYTIVSAAGHHHEHAGASKSLKRDPDTPTVSIIGLQNGSNKGGNPSNPDPYVSKQKGIKLSKPPGATAVLRRTSTKTEAFPSYGYLRTDIIHTALEALNYLTSSGSDAEILGLIQERCGPVCVELNQLKSIQTTRHSMDGTQYAAPLYSSLYLEIRSQEPVPLPVSIMPIAHACVGNTDASIEDTKRILNTIADNPYSVLLALNNLIRPDAATQITRQQILDELLGLLSVVPTNRIAGLMLDHNLRSGKWKSILTERTDDGVETSEPIITGDYLTTGASSPLSGVPLYEGGATVNISYAGTPIRMKVSDRTRNFGSVLNPFGGLRRAAKFLTVDPYDLLTGGYGTTPGVQIEPDTYAERITLVPGWQSPINHSSDNQGPDQRVPIGGQSVVLFPIVRENNSPRIVMLPCASLEDSTTIHRGCIFLSGLATLRLLDTCLPRQTVRQIKNAYRSIQNNI